MGVRNFEFNRLVITGASESYAPQLLAFLGALNLNWPDHPPIMVYDISLSDKTLSTLDFHKINHVKVPPFCPHWRKHYTWKLWCLNHAPSKAVLWLDAGCCPLSSLGEMFDVIEHLGYFVYPNHFSLEKEASEKACEGCGVDPDFRKGRQTFGGGMYGFLRNSVAETVVREALKVGMVEEYIKATQREHRHDQAIISLLMHKYVCPIIPCDGLTYAGCESPNQVAGQKIWACRRRMHPADLKYFAAHISKPGPSHLPRESHKSAMWYRMARTMYNVPRQIHRCLSGSPSPIFDGIR